MCGGKKGPEEEEPNSHAHAGNYIHLPMHTGECVHNEIAAPAFGARGGTPRVKARRRGIVTGSRARSKRRVQSSQSQEGACWEITRAFLDGSGGRGDPT